MQIKADVYPQNEIHICYSCDVGAVSQLCYG